MKGKMIRVLKNKYDEPRSGWMIAAAILLIIMGQFVVGIFVPDLNTEPTVPVKLFVTGIYSLITIGGGIFLFKIIYKQPLNHIGLIREGLMKWMLYGLSLGTLLIGMVFVILLLCGQMEVLGINTNKFFSVGLLVEIISLSFTAFSEEYLLRGFIMTALKTTRNKWIIFYTSAFIFSLIHLFNPGVTILSYVNTLLAGLLLSYMFLQTGSLWLPTGFHIAWNYLQGDILGMNVSGNTQVGVITTTMGNMNLLTGGGYGVEGGILATIVLILGFVCVRCFIKHGRIRGGSIES